jgi:hypothetical protein
MAVIDFNGTIKNASGTRYSLYTLPNNWGAAGLAVCLGNDGLCKASMLALGSTIAFDFTTTVSNYTMRGALVCMIDDPSNY